MLHVGDRLRNRRLRHRELNGGLRHAAALRDGKQDVQVAQPQPPSDARIQVHDRPITRQL